MKNAWIENNVVRDICQGNPSEMYVAEIAAHYVAEVPDDTINGATMVDGVWTNPVEIGVAALEPTAQIPIISPVEFKLLFTPQERIAIRAEQGNDPILDDLFTILDDTRLAEVNLNLESNKAVIDYLLSKGLVTEARMVEIKTGVLK